MKFAGFLAFYGFAHSALSSPLDSVGSWDVEGFAKDNPIGPTTGGKGGPKVYVNNVDDLTAALVDDEPRIVYVTGSFNLTSRLNIGSNKSLIGVGTKASFNNSGITVNSKTNVILRNLKISYVYDNDCVTIQNSTRVWVDHNEFASDISHGPDLFVSGYAKRDLKQVYSFY